MIDKIRHALIGFRKFSIVLAIMAISVWFRLAGYIDGDNVAEILTGVGTAFVAGNLVEHITDTIKKKLEK